MFSDNAADVRPPRPQSSARTWRDKVSILLATPTFEQKFLCWLSNYMPSPARVVLHLGSNYSTIAMHKALFFEPPIAIESQKGVNTLARRLGMGLTVRQILCTKRGLNNAYLNPSHQTGTNPSPSNSTSSVDALITSA